MSLASGVNGSGGYDRFMDILAIAAAVIASLIVAAIIALMRGARKHWQSRKSKPASRGAGTEEYPVRLTCKDVTEYAPGSGYREIMEIEVFNRSEKPVRIKGFGLKIAMTGPYNVWIEYVQAAQHPRVDLPVRLAPNDGLEGVIDHKSLGDEFHERGLFDFIGESTGYVDVVGFGEQTAEAASEAVK